MNSGLWQWWLRLWGRDLDAGMASLRSDGRPISPTPSARPRGTERVATDSGRGGAPEDLSLEHLLGLDAREPEPPELDPERLSA